MRFAFAAATNRLHVAMILFTETCSGVSFAAAAFFVLIEAARSVANQLRIFFSTRYSKYSVSTRI